MAKAQTSNTHTVVDCGIPVPTPFFDHAGGSNYGANRHDIASFGVDNEAFRSVELNFTTFDVHESDTLKIYEGRGTNSVLIGEYNNDLGAPGTVTSTAGAITIEFISDGADQGAGWLGEYTCVAGTAPNVFACGTNPLAFDPAGSGVDYADDTYYIETFRVDVDQAAAISFINLDIEAGDTLFVYNGPDETYPLLATYTNQSAGIGAGLSHSATGNDITILFKSNDDGTVGAGWTIAAGCDPDPDPTISSAGVPNICSLLGDTVVLSAAYDVVEGDSVSYEYAWEYATSPLGPWAAAASGTGHGNDSMSYKAGDVGFYRAILTREEYAPNGAVITVQAGGPDTTAVFRVSEGPTGTAVRPSVTPTDNSLPDKEVIVCQNESVELAAQFQDPNGDLQLLWFLDDGTGPEQLTVTGDTLTVTNTGSNTGPGKYIVAALDPSTPGNCPLRSAPDEVDVTFIATPPPTPTVNAGGPTTFCKGGQVILDRSTAPASLDVKYQWYRSGDPIPGSTGILDTARISGVYTVQATNVCGVSASNSVTVTVNDVPPAPVLDKDNVSLCEFSAGSFSTETVTATYNPDGGSYNQRWLKDGTAIPGATNLSYAVNQPGTYTFRVRNSAATSCEATADVIVNSYDGEPDDPQVQIVTNPGDAMTAWTSVPTAAGDPLRTTCVGDSIVLDAASTGAPYDYAGMTFKWYQNGTLIKGATDQYYTATVSGTYTVRAFNPCDSSADVSDDVSVTFNNPSLHQKPAITAQSTPTICNDGGNITLQTSDFGSNYSYKWERVHATGSAIIEDVKRSGTFYVNGVGELNAVGNGYDYDAPGSGQDADSAAYVVTVTHDITGCATVSEPYTLDETDEFGYWASTLGGSPSATDAIEIQFDAPAHLNDDGDEDTICVGGRTLLTAPILDANGAPGAVGPGTTLQWFLNGSEIPGANTATYWATQAGSYTLEVNNACGSEVSNSLEVVEFNVGTLSIDADGPLTFCDGDSVTLSANTPMVDANYTWDFQAFGTTGWTSYAYPEGADTNFVVADAANALTGGIFRLTAEDGDACAISTVEVKIPPRPFNPQVSAGAPLSTCQGQSVPLSTNDMTLDATYQWYVDTTGTPEPVSAATGKEFLATASGVYTVVSTTVCGEASSQDFDVQVQSGISLAAPNVTVDPSTICLGASTDLVVNNPAGSGATYTWYYSEDTATKSWQMIPASNVTTLSVLDEGFYYAKVENSANCVAQSAVVEINEQVLKPAAPTIMVGGNTELCLGDSVRLWTNANGVFGRQWKFNGNAIAGATGSSIWVENAGDYSVTIYETCDSATSFPVTITNTTTTALEQPTVDPMNPVLCQGSSQTFTANTTVANPQYQWYFNGTAIVGATNPTYTASTPGDYTVEVSNFGVSACPSVSMVSKLSFVQSSPVTPLVQSQDAFGNYKNPNICAGEEVTFALISDAPQGATYAWYEGSATPSNIISGATDSTITVSDAGNYIIEVTNACGSAVSSGFGSTVTVSGTAPSAPTVSPSAISICQGNAETLTVSNTGGLDIQWLKGGLPITGATGTTLTVTQAGTYAVRVDDNGCKNTSNNAEVSISTGAPSGISISANGSTSFCEGGTVSLNTTSALSGYDVQWLQDGTPVAGETAATINLTGLAAGTYDYSLAVTNGCGGDTSNVISITVTGAPAAPTIDPTSATICAGQSATLTANGVPAGGSIQWLQQGAPIAGETSTTYDATSAATYAVQVSVGGCVVVSDDAVVSDGGAGPAAPTITANGATDFCEGESVTLEIPSSNFTPQWQLDGADIAGANGFTFEADVAGDYTVNVENACGTSTSDNTITVTITPGPGAPVIDPATAALCDGDDVTLEATQAPAGADLQWQLNGTDIAGETGATITVSTAGDYTVTATDGCTSTSDAVSVSVSSTPDAPTVTVDENVATIENFDNSLSYQWLDENGDPIDGETGETFTNDGSAAVTVTVVASDNGCEAESAPVTVGTVGIADLVDVINVKVYPNPNNGQVVVDGAFSNATFVLYDNAGRVVANGELTTGRNELTFDVANGVYNLYILDEQGQMNTKMVITD